MNANEKRLKLLDPDVVNEDKYRTVRNRFALERARLRLLDLATTMPSLRPFAAAASETRLQNTYRLTLIAELASGAARALAHEAISGRDNVNKQLRLNEANVWRRDLRAMERLEIEVMDALIRVASHHLTDELSELINAYVDARSLVTRTRAVAVARIIDLASGHRD